MAHRRILFHVVVEHRPDKRVVIRYIVRHIARIFVGNKIGPRAHLLDAVFIRRDFTVRINLNFDRTVRSFVDIVGNFAQRNVQRLFVRKYVAELKYVLCRSLSARIFFAASER